MSDSPILAALARLDAAIAGLATRDEVARLEAAIAGLVTRDEIARLEAAIAGLVTRDEIARLEAAIAGLVTRDEIAKLRIDMMARMDRLQDTATQHSRDIGALLDLMAASQRSADEAR